jgi:DNA-directed RNA polymerase specialized sigma24 family protein
MPALMQEVLPRIAITTGIYAETTFSPICRKCFVSMSNGSLPPSARRDNGPVTSPTLVRRLQSWEDTTAWRLFVDQYNHLLEKWSRAKLRNPADVDDLKQQVLWDLARRITVFKYDPAKSFRGWLRTLHHSRLLDFLKVEKRRRAHNKQTIQVRTLAQRECLAPADEDERPLETSVKETQDTFVRALMIQQRVQDRVSVQTWAIFSEIAINGQSIADTAKRHEMRYASAFAAYSRVCRMLREEANA